VNQLRGYFTWRTRVRKGVFEKTNTSFAYMYVYELLNGIGASSSEDTLEKIRRFEEGFLDSGIGDGSMRHNIRKWMVEFAVLNEMDIETIRQCMDPETMREDDKIAVLNAPDGHSDDEVYEAMAAIAGGWYSSMQSVKTDGPTSKHVYAEAWRSARSSYRSGNEDLFQMCFGRTATYLWHPLENAIYYPRKESEPRVVTINESREYIYEQGTWMETSYHRPDRDMGPLKELMHETERQLRIYLEMKPLKEVLQESWARPFVTAAIESDRKAKIEASRPKVEIDFSDLDRIRTDAVVTRDSLLTEDEMSEELEEEIITSETHPAEEESPVGAQCQLDLSDDQLGILREVLQGRSVKSLIREMRGMAEVFADGINEAFFEEIGDSVVECDGDDIILVEDYRDDLMRLLGGDMRAGE
jgi:hypothetical protein